MFIFPKDIFFRHLKVEIALAIPALNEWRTETNSSAWPGLKHKHQRCICLCRMMHVQLIWEQHITQRGLLL